MCPRKQQKKDMRIGCPPQNIGDVRGGRGTLQGCGGEKIGVCEQAASIAQERAFVNQLTQLLGLWARLLPHEVKRAVSELLLFDTVVAGLAPCN